MRALLHARSNYKNVVARVLQHPNSHHTVCVCGYVYAYVYTYLCMCNIHTFYMYCIYVYLEKSQNPGNWLASLRGQKRSKIAKANSKPKVKFAETVRVIFWLASLLKFFPGMMYISFLHSLLSQSLYLSPSLPSFSVCPSLFFPLCLSVCLSLCLYAAFKKNTKPDIRMADS